MAISKALNGKATHNVTEINEHGSLIPNLDLMPASKDAELRVYSAINLLIDVLVSQAKQLPNQTASEPLKSKDERP